MLTIFCGNPRAPLQTDVKKCVRSNACEITQNGENTKKKNAKFEKSEP